MVTWLVGWLLSWYVGLVGMSVGMLIGWLFSIEASGVSSSGCGSRLYDGATSKASKLHCHIL